MTIKEALHNVAAQLSPYVGEGEARAMAEIIIEDIKGYTPVDVALYGYRELSPATIDRIGAIVKLVQDGQPLQYVLGNARFHGRNFKVDHSTLIPRPETSQLIDIIVDQWRGKSDLHVLDIGTGSGCIAISLALDLKFSEVYGIDISADAIEVSKINALNNKAKVKFIKADALNLSNQTFDCEHFDIIVSNPPYVLESEKATMDDRVVKYEPESALFVPDNDPLMFYKPIAKYASDILMKGGKLYFEINPLCVDSLCDMLLSTGFESVDVLCDYKGAKRFVIAGLV